jgi:formylglycine-generating enzyme required for sulfatase activity
VGERLLFNNSEQPAPVVPETPKSSPASSPTPKQLASSQGLALKTFEFETVTVNARGNITKRDNHQAKYFVEDLGNGVTLEMMQIPGGKFLMGSPAGEAGRGDDEGPQHEVTVPGFFMGKYEVTQAQYQDRVSYTIFNQFSHFVEKLKMGQATLAAAWRFLEQQSSELSLC